MTPDTKAIDVGVWYENVGKEPRVVPDHKGNKANMSLIWFEGKYDGKKYEFRYEVERDGTSLPKAITLEKGDRFKERFRIHFGNPFGGDHSRARNDFWGLPKLTPGKSMSLQVVYPAWEKSRIGKTFGKEKLYDSAVERRSEIIRIRCGGMVSVSRVHQ